MSEPVKPRPIAALAGGGAVGQGELVGFGFQLKDGSQEWFSCEHTQLHKIVDGLRTFGHIAQKERKARPGGEPLEGLAHPYLVNAFRTGRGRGVGNPPIEAVGIEFRTQEGIPVTVAIPVPVAEKLVEALEVELGRETPKFPRQ
jgi:hypothetical protein